MSSFGLFLIEHHVYYVNSFMRVQVGLCSYVLSQNSQIEIFLDSDFLSIKNQGLLFVQPKSHN